MMPNYPDLEREFMAFLGDFMTLRMRHHLGPMDRIKRVTHFEGDGTTTFRREDGSEETSGMEHFSEKLEIPTEKLRRFNPIELTKLLDELMQKMAAHYARHTYDTVGKTAEKAGQVVNANGEKFSAELFFKLLESIEIDFTPDGVARMPELHLSTAMAERAVEVGREMEASDAHRARHQALMEKKKEEWRAREARRTLVG